jgi:hypothetical protein
MQTMRKRLEQSLIEKATKDHAFRRQLMENPKTIVEQETGITLPDGLKIRVLEEDANSVYLVLPSIMYSWDENELSEAELQQVSGGNDTECSTWSWVTECNAIQSHNCEGG